MKITTASLLLLGLAGAAFAQDAPTQATTHAQTEPPATSEAPVTGHTVTRDAAGHTVIVTS